MRTFSEEHRRKLSSAHTGKPSGRKGVSLLSVTKKKISEKLKGRRLSEETKKKMLGRIPWNKGKRGLCVAWNKGLLGFMKGRRMPVESRRLMSEARKGCRGSNWRGGIADANEAARKNVEYRIWREAVFERDNWTCQECGVRGGKIQADHIKPFAYFPDERFSVENGRTLCVGCHKKTDTYGRNLPKTYGIRIG